jgi:hypothetical protein
MIDVIKPVASAATAGIAAWWVVQGGFPWLILSVLSAAIVGLVVYLAASTLLRAEGARMIWFKAKGVVAKKFNRKFYGS